MWCNPVQLYAGLSWALVGKLRMEVYFHRFWRLEIHTPSLSIQLSTSSLSVPKHFLFRTSEKCWWDHSRPHISLCSLFGCIIIVFALSWAWDSLCRTCPSHICLAIWSPCLSAIGKSACQGALLSLASGTSTKIWAHKQGKHQVEWQCASTS